MKYKHTISLILGAILLIIGIVWAFASNQPANQSPAKVKQTIVPLPSDAFNDDPHLQSAAQNLLQQQSSPQNANSDTMNALQPQQGTQQSAPAQPQQ